jgi:hypothetical protein
MAPGQIGRADKQTLSAPHIFTYARMSKKDISGKFAECVKKQSMAKLRKNIRTCSG